jgi:hypothetical protein
VAVLATPNDTDSESNVRLFLANSHRTGALILSLGFFRLACENQLPFALPGLTLRVVHRGHAIERVQEGLPLLLNQIGARQDLRARLMGRVASEEEAQAVVSAVERLRGIQEGTSEGILQVRRYEDTAFNAWTLLNQGQEAIVRGGILSNGRAVQALRSPVSQLNASAKFIQEAVKIFA